MKKLFFALALACTLQVAYAQKSDADMQKAVDKALAAAQDAKKATKAATWINLGKAYMTAYQNPLANVTQGIDKTTFGMMFKERPSGVEKVELDGKTYEKQIFSHFNAYFNEMGLLTITEVTRPSVQGDLLGEAAKAYSKAFELGAKDKDVDPKIQEIVDTIGKDYSQKVKAFEEDRETVINASTAATEKLFKASEEFKDSLVDVQTKLNISLILNVVSLVVIGIIVYLLSK